MRSDEKCVNGNKKIKCFSGCEKSGVRTGFNSDEVTTLHSERLNASSFAVVTGTAAFVVLVGVASPLSSWTGNKPEMTGSGNQHETERRRSRSGVSCFGQTCYPEEDIHPPAEA